MKTWLALKEYETGNKYGGISYKDGRLEMTDDNLLIKKTLPEGIRLCHLEEVDLIPKEVLSSIRLMVDWQLALIIANSIYGIANGGREEDLKRLALMDEWLRTMEGK